MIGMLLLSLLSAEPRQGGLFIASGWAFIDNHYGNRKVEWAIPCYCGIQQQTLRGTLLPGESRYVWVHCVQYTEQVAWLSDSDNDNDVDNVDFGEFTCCVNGTGNLYPPGCRWADLDGDHSVDNIDAAIFASCYNGSGNRPACDP